MWRFVGHSSQISADFSWVDWTSLCQGAVPNADPRSPSKFQRSCNTPGAALCLKGRSWEHITLSEATYTCCVSQVDTWVSWPGSEGEGAGQGALAESRPRLPFYLDIAVDFFNSPALAELVAPVTADFAIMRFFLQGFRRSLMSSKLLACGICSLQKSSVVVWWIWWLRFAHPLTGSFSCPFSLSFLKSTFLLKLKALTLPCTYTCMKYYNN